MTNCRCDPFTGDECQACKNKLLVDKAEYERLKRLEAAAIESELQRVRKEISEYEAFVNRDSEHQTAEKARTQ